MFSVVIPIKNQFKIIKMCLESIVRHCKNEEIIIIDDGSTEVETKNFLNLITSNEHWKLIRNDKSFGHTKACEQGIGNSSHENIFLLNSDTILTENSLQSLSNVLDQNNDIAVVGPSTSSASGPQIIKELYNKRFTMSIKEIDAYGKKLASTKSEIIDIELVNGFCFGIKKSVFVKIGGFDPVLTCYGNEKELLIRIRNAGCRTVHVKNSYVHHFGKVSYSKEKINIGKAQIDADRYIRKKFGLK